MKEIKIEKGIPIGQKEGKHYAFSDYPFDKMTVGDSFVAPLYKGVGIKNLQSRVLAHAKYFTFKTKNKWKFKSTQLTKGVRVWRIS